MASEFLLISIDLRAFDTGLLKLPIQKQPRAGAWWTIRNLNALLAEIGDAGNTFRVSLGQKKPLLSFAEIYQDRRFTFKFLGSKIKIVFLFVRLHQVTGCQVAKVTAQRTQTA